MLKEHTGSLSPQQRAWCIDAVTVGDVGPHGHRVDAAYQLMQLPEARAATIAIWRRWVLNEAFDERDDPSVGHSLVVLYNYMNFAQRDGYAEFSAVNDDHRLRVRRAMRSSDAHQIARAMSWLKIACQTSCVGRKGLAEEVYDAIGTSQWDELPAHYRDAFERPITDVAAAILAELSPWPAFRSYSDRIEALEAATPGTRAPDAGA